MKRIWLVMLGVALLAVIGLGTLTLVTPAEARGRCICPKINAPVECDNGRTYPNQCVADCRNAQNCVPTGDL
jgi:hypothetical protein